MAEWVDVPLTPVVLLEGVSSARAAVAVELSYSVWITTRAKFGCNGASSATAPRPGPSGMSGWPPRTTTSA